MISNWDQLINTSYRSLLYSGRNYASFSKGQIDTYVKRCKDLNAALVFDPMSGYGTLTEECNKYNIATFNVEINTPAYLWQYLRLPENNRDFHLILNNLINSNIQLPSSSRISEAGSDWISSYGLSLLSYIYEGIFSSIAKLSLSIDYETAALAITLPFVCRIATVTNGDIHHVKKGGLAVYNNYIEDFWLYINFLFSNFFGKAESSHCDKNAKNILLLDNCQTSCFLKTKFSFMITSPPYPNLIDYAKMFGAENYFLDHLRNQGRISIPQFGEPIGTNIVVGKDSGELLSSSAKDFVAKIQNYNKTPKMKKDNLGYYAPYFKNYFFNLEKAYRNIAYYANDTFEGVIIVRNNAARIYTVPVAESICEIWKELGFNTELLHADEVFHVGTKNPNSKGFKAKQTEYAIRIWR